MGGDRGADGVLLLDEAFGLIFLDLLFEGGDAGELGFFGVGEFGEGGEELVGDVFFSGVDCGGELFGLRGEAVDDAAEAGGFGAAPGELVVADAACARSEADDAAALAVDFPFEFHLPVVEFALDFFVFRGLFGHFLGGFGEGIAIGGGGFGDLALEFGLLFFGEAGAGETIFGEGIGIGDEELGVEGFVPLGALDGDIGFQLGNFFFDVAFVIFRDLADLFDFGFAFFFDHGVDGVFEEEEGEGVGDGESHEDGDDEAEAELGEFAGPGLEGAVGGEEGAVDREDDEGPDEGHGDDDIPVIGDGGEGVGAGDEGEDGGDEDGRAEGDVFSLFPGGAGFEGFGAGAGEPEEGVFDFAWCRHGDGVAIWVDGDGLIGWWRDGAGPLRETGVGPETFRKS